MPTEAGKDPCVHDAVSMGDLDPAFLASDSVAAGTVAVDTATSSLSLPVRDNMAAAHSTLASTLTATATHQCKHAAALMWQ
jgi:hypothetical protein